MYHTPIAIQEFQPDNGNHFIFLKKCLLDNSTLPDKAQSFIRKPNPSIIQYNFLQTRGRGKAFLNIRHGLIQKHMFHEPNIHMNIRVFHPLPREAYTNANSYDQQKEFSH